MISASRQRSARHEPRRQRFYFPLPWPLPEAAPPAIEAEEIDLDKLIAGQIVVLEEELADHPALAAALARADRHLEHVEAVARMLFAGAAVIAREGG